MHFIPDVAQIFKESHQVFDWYKDILIEYINGPCNVYLGV
jgi:hypothetical protein